MKIVEIIKWKENNENDEIWQWNIEIMKNNENQWKYVIAIWWKKYNININQWHSNYYIEKWN